MVGQEDELANRMTKLGIIPVIAKFAFVYHYKSITVSSAKQNFRQSGLAGHHSYILRNSLDRRENLTYFHPELQSNAINQPSTFINYSKIIGIDDKIRLYPPASKSITFGYAVSNPNMSPGAGDLYTAQELAETLGMTFQNVQSLYLYKGSQWYDLESLQQLDVLVTLVDSYDIAKAQLIHKRPAFKGKTLIYVAWIRNWFQRWISRPYIGNYDLLLVSSSTSLQFYNSYASKYGFNVKCVQHCPTIFLKETISSNETRIVFGSERRANIPIELFRIATNVNRFSPDPFNMYQYRPYQLIFTGSYYNRTRDITLFDPLSVDNVNLGNVLLIGENWNQSDISINWRQVYIGPRPYEHMVKFYRNSKIVLDDANIATMHWGSVNSRVFDALACEALVITNGKLGSFEVFNGVLPFYESLSELKSVIKYYLENDRIRLELIKKLRTEILKHHSYYHRSWSFHDFMKKFNLYLTPSNYTLNHSKLREQSVSVDSIPLENTDTSGITEICIGIRTVKRQQMDVQLLIESLILQHFRSIHQTDIHMKLFIVDTEGIGITEWYDIVNVINQKSMQIYKVISKLHHRVEVFVIDRDLSARESNRRQNRLFGYDDTDILTNFLLSQSSFKCNWILHTNGDNMYNAAWLDSVATFIKDPSIDIIGWDFVTHHQREAGQTQQLIPIVLERGHVDLGSVMVRKHLYSPLFANDTIVEAIKRSSTVINISSIFTGTHWSHRIQFLPDSIFTRDIHARDYFTIKSLLRQARNDSVRLVHKCLLFHQ